jgi:hypothetical protein
MHFWFADFTAILPPPHFFHVLFILPVIFPFIFQYFFLDFPADAIFLFSFDIQVPPLLSPYCRFGISMSAVLWIWIRIDFGRLDPDADH